MTEILASDAALGGLFDDQEADEGAAERPAEADVDLQQDGGVATQAALLHLVALRASSSSSSSSDAISTVG